MKKKRFKNLCFKFKSLPQVCYPKYNTTLVLSLTWAGFWSLIQTPWDHTWWWNKWHHPALFLERSCAVTLPCSVASDGCINTKRDQKGPNRHADQMVNVTKCSTGPSTMLALLAQAQQDVNAGLTYPDCTWPQARKSSSTLYVSHKELQLDLWPTTWLGCCPVGTSALPSRRGHLQDCVPCWLWTTLAKSKAKTVVQLSLLEDIYTTSRAFIYSLGSDSMAPR